MSSLVMPLIGGLLDFFVGPSRTHSLLRCRQSHLAALGLAIIFVLFFIGMLPTISYNLVSNDRWPGSTVNALLLTLTIMLIPLSLVWIAIRVFVATSKQHTSAENPEASLNDPCLAHITAVAVTRFMTVRYHRKATCLLGRPGVPSTLHVSAPLIEETRRGRA